MKKLKEMFDQIASRHEAEGGNCTTISIQGVEYKCCLDENGKIKDPLLRAYAYQSNQLPSSE